MNINNNNITNNKTKLCYFLTFVCKILSKLLVINNKLVFCIRYFFFQKFVCLIKKRHLFIYTLTNKFKHINFHN